jgi:hypothetical protein
MSPKPATNAETVPDGADSVGGKPVTDLDDTDLQAAYYCVAEVRRHRQRKGQPVPAWLHRHYDRMDAAFLMSLAGHESDCSTPQSKNDEWISTKEAAAIVNLSPRHVRRIQADLCGEKRVGRLLFPLHAVTEYAEGRRSV